MADLTVTAASVLKYSDAVVKYGVCGAAITQGQSVYIDASNLWQLADANLSAAAAATGGVALNTTTAINQDIAVLTGGSWNPGAPVTDLASGWFTTILGVGITSTKITMPQNGPIVSGVAVP